MHDLDIGFESLCNYVLDMFICHVVLQVVGEGNNIDNPANLLCHVIILHVLLSTPPSHWWALQSRRCIKEELDEELDEESDSAFDRELETAMLEGGVVAVLLFDCTSSLVRSMC